ncbi:hypothetical protein, partial [uncultured Clostridium sp.]
WILLYIMAVSIFPIGNIVSAKAIENVVPQYFNYNVGSITSISMYKDRAVYIDSRYEGDKSENNGLLDLNKMKGYLCLLNDGTSKDIMKLGSNVGVGLSSRVGKKAYITHMANSKEEDFSYDLITNKSSKIDKNQLSNDELLKIFSEKYKKQNNKLVAENVVSFISYDKKGNRLDYYYAYIIDVNNDTVTPMGEYIFISENYNDFKVYPVKGYPSLISYENNIVTFRCTNGNNGSKDYICKIEKGSSTDFDFDGEVEKWYRSEMIDNDLYIIDKDGLEKYVLKDGKYIKKDTKKNVVDFTTDINNKVWILNRNNDSMFVSQLDGTKMIDKFEVLTDMNTINVYDDNNVIVSGEEKFTAINIGNETYDKEDNQEEKVDKNKGSEVTKNDSAKTNNTSDKVVDMNNKKNKIDKLTKTGSPFSKNIFVFVGTLLSSVGVILTVRRR